MTTPRSQVFGTEARFNENVTFLKNVDIGGKVSFVGPISFNVPVTFEEDVFFEKSIFVGQDATIDQNLSVGGISTFNNFVDINNSVDIDDILTVRTRLNVGVAGTALTVDARTNNIGIYTADPTDGSRLSFGFNEEGLTIDTRTRNIGIFTTTSGEEGTKLSFGNNEEGLNIDTRTNRLGIFTSSPVESFQFNSGVSSTFVITDEGRVGIGTTQPESGIVGLDTSAQGELKLNIKGSVSIDRNIYDSAGSPGLNGAFLNRDENGIRWVTFEPAFSEGIFVQDEGVFIPVVGAAQSFTVLNFTNINSQGVGVDNLIPIPDPSNPLEIARIQTQDLWGYTENSDIFRMSAVGVNNNAPSFQLDVSGTLRATGQVRFTDGTDSSDTGSGALVVTGGVGIGLQVNIGSNLDVGGNANVSGNLDVGGDGTIGGNLDVGGDGTIGGNLDVGGTGVIGATDGSNDTTSGALVVGGGVGIGQNVNMGGDLDVAGAGIIQSEDGSSSTATGALVVGGGVGIGENLYMGGSLDVVGNADVDGDLDVGGEGRFGDLLELDGPLKDFNDSVATGRTDYRLSSIYHDTGNGIGVSWRPPGVQTKKTIWVSKNGSDLNSGLLEGDAKASLGGAAAVAQEGDTIKIRPGKYLENNPVGLRTDVSVTGEDIRLVTIVPENKNDDVIHVRRGCLVENLSFAGGVVGTGVEIGCDRAGAVAFPPTQVDIDAGISVRARSGFTGLGPADEGSSGRWRSPYVRNCTNFMTGSIGMKINGDHATASDPDSGADLKSMVCDSFTQYNEAGIGVSLSNDAYAQLVSIFTINCDIAIYAETGGQCDLTNSNSSFGNFGLVAVGLGATQYTGFASNTNSAGQIITENATETDTIVAYGVTDSGGDDQRPFDGQALYFKINNVGRQNYPTVPEFPQLEAPMKELSAIEIIPGASLSGYSALNPPSVTILDEDVVNNPGRGPLGPQGIVAEGSATVDQTGTITEFNVIASGRNYLPTQNLVVSVDGDTGIATAITEPIFYTVFEATPNTGYFNALGGEADPNIVGITTITFNEFIPYAVFPDDPFTLQRISRILTSSHSFEYVGTGTDINRSTPLVGGVTIKANEIVASGGAQIPFTSTDQKGNFDIGEGLQIDQTTSTIRGRDFSRAIQVEVTPLILALR